MEPTPINPRKRSRALYVMGVLLLLAAGGAVYYFVYDRYIQVASARSANVWVVHQNLLGFSCVDGMRRGEFPAISSFQITL